MIFTAAAPRVSAKGFAITFALDQLVKPIDHAFVVEQVTLIVRIVVKPHQQFFRQEVPAAVLSQLDNPLFNAIPLGNGIGQRLQQANLYLMLAVDHLGIKHR